MHSGLKSSFVTFMPTNVVAIEQVNVTLSRRSNRKHFVDFKIFQLKMSSCKHSDGHFYPNKNDDRNLAF